MNDIEGIVRDLKTTVELLFQDGYITKSTKDKIVLAVLALEKQMPKKPRISDKFPTQVKSENKFICPVCEARVGGVDDNGVFGCYYCYDCGQKLDWLEVENE